MNPFFDRALEDVYDEQSEGVMGSMEVPFSDYTFETGPRGDIELAMPETMIEDEPMTFAYDDEDPDIQAQRLYDKADEKFIAMMKEVENGIKAGYDEETALWTPHESVEGGSDTIGYGHKLKPGEVKNGFIIIDGEKVDYNKGLTDEQVDALLMQDMNKAETALAKNIEGYEDLPDKYQKVLINLAFNIGAGKVNKKGWPKLFKAIKEGDDATVAKEMVTKFKDKNGKWRPLTTRAQKMAKVSGIGGELNYMRGVAAQ